MKLIARAGAAVLACVLVLTGCSEPEPSRDGAGLTESEAAEMTFREQYRAAGEQHRALNELFAEVQAQIYPGEWIEGGTRSEVVPGSAHMVAQGRGIRGVTRDNTYYFTVARFLTPDRDVKDMVRETAAAWRERGWEVSEESFTGGTIRVVATTPDGYWFSCNEDSATKLSLHGHSPVYWTTDNHTLLGAVADRRNAETAAGATWSTTDRDENGRASRLPGVYRPFPAWDALPDDPATEPQE